jgi:hypothetical protein
MVRMSTASRRRYSSACPANLSSTSRRCRNTVQQNAAMTLAVPAPTASTHSMAGVLLPRAPESARHHRHAAAAVKKTPAMVTSLIRRNRRTWSPQGLLYLLISLKRLSVSLSYSLLQQVSRYPVNHIDHDHVDAPQYIRANGDITAMGSM